MTGVIEAVAVEMMTEAEARDLTDRICHQFGQLWELLAIAQDRRAWAALGYASFKEYVEAELPVSRGQAYRLVDQGRVTAELSAAAGTAVTVSARAAAAVKPHLAETAERIREATKGQHEPRRQETVAAIVGEVADHEPDPRESVSRARDTSSNNRRSESRAPETSPEDDAPNPPPPSAPTGERSHLTADDIPWVLEWLNGLPVTKTKDVPLQVVRDHVLWAKRAEQQAIRLSADQTADRYRGGQASERREVVPNFKGVKK